ncbi:MAG: hypothetical protein SFV81_23105 [Pirellulaceae bacterium]|nr:hypothetical protein [Pirellulaceae bacterium]
MKSRNWAIVGLLQVLALAPIQTQAQINTRAVKTEVNAKTILMETGDSWMDYAVEAELIRDLGMKPDEINPPVPAAMRAAVDNDPTNGGGGNGGGGSGGTGPVGTSGVLPSPSSILSQNRLGKFTQVGTTNLAFMLDETWLWIEGQVRDGIYDKLANAHREQTGPDLEGFYNIQISMAPFTTATKRVYVWPDKHKMRLTWTLANNSISCRASLNNWPDRDVDIVTTIHMVVDIQATGSKTDPTDVVYSYLYFSNTQASNDGILYEETFNNATEAEFNSTFEEIPAALPDLMFRPLSQTLASKLAPTSLDLKFDYVTAQSRLVFRIFNPTRSLPTLDVQPVNTATTLRR